MALRICPICEQVVDGRGLRLHIVQLHGLEHTEAGELSKAAERSELVDDPVDWARKRREDEILRAWLQDNADRLPIHAQKALEILSERLDG